ncbi:unnamed protein product [Durusdinium trenchii]|uniref:Uncharacterized protein n=1 Tax=Durusdinium trenchii TaxID=1381693 RepID=A0ABP0IZM1_9DINO
MFASIKPKLWEMQVEAPWLLVALATDIRERSLSLNSFSQVPAEAAEELVKRFGGWCYVESSAFFPDTVQLVVHEALEAASSYYRRYRATGLGTTCVFRVPQDLDDDLEEIDEAAGAWDADPVDPAFTAYEAGGADHGGTGDVEGDPYCLRHYRRALERWCLITSEYLPKSEQALRALDALTGDAALEVEEIPDSKYFRDDGIEILLKDLEVAFGEREIYRRGGLIREFENLSRMQGESVDAFVRRYKLYERKLQDAKIAAYPSETRAVKLLDGLRLSEQATSQLLLAAGNRYDMDAILNALKVQYPPGLTLTGLTRHPTAISTHVKGRGRGNHGRGRSRSGGSFKWRTWHTEAQEDEMPEDNTVPETFTGYEAYEISNDIALENANDLLDDVFEYQFDDYEADLEEGLPEQAPEEGYDDGPEEQAEALTATSKKMASATQSRGYYLSAAAKGKGKGGGGKGKDKGDGKKGFGSSSSSSTSFQKGKGLGKPSKGSTKGSGKGGGKNKSSTQRHRLQASLCLGCDSSEHWLRDCPHVTQHQAHVCASSTTLDGEGMVVWMVGHNKMPLDAEDDLATHGLEEFLPEGCSGNSLLLMTIEGKPSWTAAPEKGDEKLWLSHETLTVHNDQSPVTEDQAREALSQLGDSSTRRHAYLRCDLVGMELTSLVKLRRWEQLQFLNVSRNRLRSLEPVGALRHLLHLDASHNLLIRSQSFTAPDALETCDMSYNMLAELGDWKVHRYLRELNLRGNYISIVGHGLKGNLELRSLDLSENFLLKLGEDLDDLELRSLSLAQNKLSSLEGIQKLAKLHCLDVRHNQITTITALRAEDIPRLRKLRLAENRISQMREVDQLASFVFLSELYMQPNPVSQLPQYRAQVLHRLPRLRQLDSQQVTPEERVKTEVIFGADVETRQEIFEQLLPEETFVDRRLMTEELIAQLEMEQFGCHGDAGPFGCEATSDPTFGDPPRTKLQVAKFRQRVEQTRRGGSPEGVANFSTYPAPYHSSFAYDEDLPEILEAVAEGGCQELWLGAAEISPQGRPRIAWYRRSSDFPFCQSSLRAMASDLISDGLQPKIDGLQPKSKCLQPKSGGLQPTSAGLQPTSDGLQSNLRAMASLFPF